jgi:hypothetical protein
MKDIEARFSTGQRVRIIPLIDGFGRPDPRVSDFVGQAGEVGRSYFVSRDEVWEKTLKLLDVFCYDVLLDGGEMARGIPEPGLEADIPFRR